MGSRRLAIARRRMEPARPSRYLAALSVVGLIHGLVAASMAGPLWADALVLLVPAAWMTGWLLRRRIAAARGGTLLGVTLWAVLLGAFLAGTLYGFRLAVEAVEQRDWNNAIEAVLFCWFFGFFVPAVTALVLLPMVLVSLPLTWGAVLLLRAAAGGTVELPAWARRFERGASSPLPGCSLRW